MPVWQASAARKDQHGDRRAGAFAEPHAEIEQRMQAKLLKQKPMSRLGRQVTGERMVERAGAKLGPWRHGGGADEAVEQRRDAPMPRGERGAEDGGKLASAERGRDAQRIAEDRAVSGERRVDRLALALEAAFVDAGAVAGEACAAAAEQRRRDGRGGSGIADAHLAQHHEIGLGRKRVVSRRHGFEELGVVHGGLGGEIRRGVIEVERDDAELRAAKSARAD